MMSVAGGPTDLRAGEAVEAVGQVAEGRRTTQPGRVRLSRVPPRPGDRLAPDGERAVGAYVAIPTGRAGRSRGAGSDPGLEPPTAGGPVRPGDAPLAAALLLGQREDIEPEVNDAFARTGTTHLLAISGLQLQVLAVALRAAASARWACRAPALMRPSPWGRSAMPLLVGLAPSVVRSTVMTVTLLPGRRRRADPARQHAGPGRPGRRWASIRVPVRRRLPALVPGDRSPWSGWCRRPARWCRQAGRGDPGPAPRASFAARRPGAAAPSLGGARRCDRRREELVNAVVGLDRRLAGGAAAGRPRSSTSSRRSASS